MVTHETTRKITVGQTAIGGGSPVTVQSMLNVPAHDVAGNVAQALRLQEAGCEILRVSVPDREAVKTVAALKEALTVPLVADIHFDWRLAIESVAAGVDKVRINPGNIGSAEHVAQVAKVCRENGVPIRIGVNSGSLEKEILARYGSPTPEAMVESGLYHISLLERCDFDQIVLSLKSSDPQRMYDAYVLAAERCPYPLHLGVTEAGTAHLGEIKSAAGIGGLLLRGIGDTVRISLTDDPVREVEAGMTLLRTLGIRRQGIRLVSCPTCGRTSIDLIGLAKEAERRLAGVSKDLTVAIMGCVVNGPGEAREADIGIAGGNGCGILFKHGEIVRKNVPEDRLLETLMTEIESM